MFKKISFGILVVFLAIGVSVQFGWAATKVYSWNYHTAYDSTYYNGGSHIQSWADRVWEETNHQLKINIFYNSGLGFKGNEVMSSLRDGLVHSAEFSATLYALEAKQPWWLYADFLAEYDNPKQMKAVDDVAFPMLWQNILDFGGVKPLALFNATPVDTIEGIWMNKKITKWDDFKGSKIRLFFALARKYVFDPMGVQTLFLPGPETYQGLKTGLVDGAIQTPAAGFSGSYYKIAKYFYAFEPINSCWWGILCSQKAFDALPKDVQEGLVRASKDHERFLNEEVWQNPCKYTPGPGGSPYCDRDIIKFFQKQGNIVVRVPLITKKVREQNAIGIQKWIAVEGGPNAQKLYDTYTKAMKMYPEIDMPTFMSLDEWTVKE
jgi:TRAP-type C4-dicarboxylate transport system substrate-binding protein